MSFEKVCKCLASSGTITVVDRCMALCWCVLGATKRRIVNPIYYYALRSRYDVGQYLWFKHNWSVVQSVRMAFINIER